MAVLVAVEDEQVRAGFSLLGRDFRPLVPSGRCGAQVSNRVGQLVLGAEPELSEPRSNSARTNLKGVNDLIYVVGPVRSARRQCPHWLGRPLGRYEGAALTAVPGDPCA